MAFLVSFGMTNFEGIFGLYALEKFDYDPQRVGTIMVVMGIVTAVVQGGLSGPLTKRWGETAVPPPLSSQTNTSSTIIPLCLMR